jgi:hypothetical protein
VDEGDFVFRADANPELLQIFNAGNDRAFAFVMRSIPLGNGQFEDHDFNTFAAMCFTSIAKLPTKSMQSRCIGLPMRPATREEAASLSRFRADRAQDLSDCGRKFARWAADLVELPEVEIPAHFVNRIADNWRSLFQIAHLAGGDWPARVLAAAQADADGDAEEPRERGANGLLEAIWRVFNAETTDPRRMHTLDLVGKLLNLDDGRWRVEHKGKPIDEYYLRSKLRGYVTPPDKGGKNGMPSRQWRPPNSTIHKWGYHELHFRDAFQRYLGEGLPSETPPRGPGAEKGDPPEQPFSPSTPPPSAPSAPDDVSPAKSKAHAGADAGADADEQSAPSSSAPRSSASNGADKPPAPDGADELSASAPVSAPSQHTEVNSKRGNGADGADARGVEGEKEERTKADALGDLPHGPVGRKRREAR